MHVLTSGPRTGVPVVLLHGNTFNARSWEETMSALPPEYRAIATDQRGFGDTEPLPIDATRGFRDWSDDIKELADVLSLQRFHLVGWSLGGGVAMQYAIDHPAEIISLTLVAPTPPYGMGGTKDEKGTPIYEDYAGAGGGRTNRDLVRRIAEGDRGAESPFSPRNVMNAFYFKPPFRIPPEREELYVSAILATCTGDDFFPGDFVTSANWPGVAPGTRGTYNAASPKYCNLQGLADIDPKPPILWLRGADDQIISDMSPFDAGTLGQLGRIPGWPGAEVYPPQPMLQQLRHLFEAYAQNGGRYYERVINDCGHSAPIEKPQEFQAALFRHLRLAGKRQS